MERRQVCKLGTGCPNIDIAEHCEKLAHLQPTEMLEDIGREYAAGHVESARGRLNALREHMDLVGNTPMCVAAAAGDALGCALIADLLGPESANAAQAYGATPLSIAAARGDAGVVRAVLAAGATVGSTNASTNITPLHHAAKAGSGVEILRALVEAGGEVNAADHNGMTPLHEAAWAGDLPAIEFLVAQGADVNYSGGFCDESPMRVAAGEGNIDAVKLLASLGGTSGGRDSNGRTMAEMAALHGFEDNALQGL